MAEPSLTDDYQRRRDREHLTLLAVFHFIVGGLALLGTGFLFLHYIIIRSYFGYAERLPIADGHSPPAQLGDVFQVFAWFYVVIGSLLLVKCIGNLLSGVFLYRRKHRTFSLVVAGIDCLFMPLGTVLGVCTIFVLLRDSVRESYGD